LKVSRIRRVDYRAGQVTCAEEIMTGSRRWITYFLLAYMTAGIFVLPAQEPQGGQPRPPAGRGSTREFLGLGPAPNAAAAKKGEPLFKQNCATCHGETARGAQGPNLLRSVVVLHDEQENEIGPLIRNGRPQAGMPPFPQLSASDIHNISEYIKLQVEQAANRGIYNQLYAGSKNELHGDPTKGREFFESHCSSCHSATGDLAKIGTKFPQASVLQSRFLWPVSREPAHVSVSTPSGDTVTGTIITLDDFDVAIRDSNGDYRYWPRSQVKVTVVDKLQGHRSLLPQYADADIHNVTAYLETLK
jgi:cytochrome c oxidase cbb3-type subunit III